MPSDNITEKETIFSHGSTWVRADFHLHTRADREFQYAGEENSFIGEYVAKLKEANIRVGVITNHNKFDYDEFRALRKKAKREGIFLLPGVELAVSDGANGIHVLFVFSDEWLQKKANGADEINIKLATLVQGNDSGRIAANLLQTVAEFDKAALDYFIVFAHVEQNNGIWKEFGGGRMCDFAEKNYEAVRKRVLAFQKVRTNDDREQVKKHLQEWYPAEVEGSDCKSLVDIGRGKSVYLKIGAFNYEAIKFSLLDYDSRTMQGEPKRYQHSYIESIYFEGGVLDKQTINFSPELNTLIGIRGSGKSSVIEAIRYVLGIQFGEKTMDQDYKGNLMSHILKSGGKAVITAFDQYGQAYQVQRILNELPEVFVQGKLQPGITIMETVIRKPIYFGQKDLSSSGDGFEKDLIEKLVGDRLTDIRLQIEVQKQNVNDIAAILGKISDGESQKQEYQRMLQDAEYNLKKYYEYGVAEKFSKQMQFEADERKAGEIVKDTADFIATYNSFINAEYENLYVHSQYRSEQNDEWFRTFLGEYAKVLKVLADAKKACTELAAFLANIEVQYKKLQDIKNSFQEEFAAVRRALSAELEAKGVVSLNIEELPVLQKKVENIRKTLEGLTKQGDKKDALKKELLLATAQLKELWHQEYLLIKVELEKINSHGIMLSLECGFKEDKKQFLDYMKSMLRGSGIRETRIFDMVERYSDVGDIYKDWDNVKLLLGASAGAFEEYFFKYIGAFLTWQVPNRYAIKYRNKELKEHSLGQRASALILFVLSQQENDLIIIDQPEDDLDSQTIYEDVIKFILQLKRKVQFIFATHNANIPVLGDAEQVLSCRYIEDKIAINSGSVDCSAIQNDIVDIMEGGAEAFKRRKEIYGIWKLRN